MIPFSFNSLTTEVLFIRQVTTALGGSIEYYSDPTQMWNYGAETTKESIPVTLARRFISIYDKVTKYLRPCPVLVTRYDGNIIAMERHPLAMNGTDPKSPTMYADWAPITTASINTHLQKITSNGDEWMFDGRYAYTFGSDVDVSLFMSTPISAKLPFSVVRVRAYDLHRLSSREAGGTEVRECLAFTSSTGDYGITSPIWASFESIKSHITGKSARSSDADLAIDAVDRMQVRYINPTDVDKAAEFWFDKANDTVSVNVAFVTYVATKLLPLFGEEVLTPLNIPELMVSMRTLNIVNIDTPIKNTHPVGWDLHTALAWLIGLSRGVTDPVAFNTIQQCIKYLTVYGCFPNHKLANLLAYDGAINDLLDKKVDVEAQLV